MSAISLLHAVERRLGTSRKFLHKQRLSKQFWRWFLQNGLFIPITFLALMFWRSPHLVTADFDYDEGINLMKAMLYHQGYSLYVDIWSDQPPLLTALLSWWFALWNESVAAARLLIMLFSASLLWSLYLLVRATTSTFSALIALVLLAVSEYYLRLSGAVMVGLPALAVATASIMILLVGQPRIWRLVLSAMVMGIALQIKLMAALVIPALIVHLLLVGPGNDSEGNLLRSRLARCALWLSILTVTFFGIGLYFQSLRPDMLLIPHFGEQTRLANAFIRASSTFLPNFYSQHLLYLITACVGLFWAFRRHHKAILLPCIWILTTWLALFFHRPLWYHHVTLLTVPLTWLCAFGIEFWSEGWRHLEEKIGNSRRPVFEWRRGLLLAVAGTFIAALLLYPKPLPQRVSEQMNLNRPVYNGSTVEQLSAETAVATATDTNTNTAWIFTDRPFYGFTVGAPVPPPIAVMSRKRLQAGELSDEILLATLETYRPEYIVLERFIDIYSESLLEQILNDYEVIQKTDTLWYFQLSS